MFVRLLGSVRFLDPPQSATDSRQLRPGCALRDFQEKLIGRRARHRRDLPDLIERQLPGLKRRSDFRQESQSLPDPQQLDACVHVEAGLGRHPVLERPDAAGAPTTDGVELGARRCHLRERRVSDRRELTNPVIQRLGAVLVFEAYRGVLHTLDFTKHLFGCKTINRLVSQNRRGRQ